MSSLGGEIGDGWDGHISFSPLFVSDCFYMVVYIFIQGEKRKIFPLGRGVHLINHWGKQTDHLLSKSLQTSQWLQVLYDSMTFKQRSPNAHHWATGVLKEGEKGKGGKRQKKNREGSEAMAAGPSATSPPTPGHQPWQPWTSTYYQKEPREKAPTFTWSTWHVSPHLTERFCSAFFSPIRNSCLNLAYAVWMSCRDTKLLERSSVLTSSLGGLWMIL